MRAWLIPGVVDLTQNDKPLIISDIPVPEPGQGEILIRVKACGVCHTEIDEIEGRTAPPEYPVVPGHQIIGIVAKSGKGTSLFNAGDRVGIGWIWSACGVCKYCREGNENLCADFLATGRDRNGGYAEYTVVPEKFACAIPSIYQDAEAAPLLCAGAVGYRSLMLCNLNDGENLGLTGFGASGHIVLKLAQHLYPDSNVFVFARSREEQKFALDLGAYWAGDAEDTCPEKLTAIIDTTPVWKPIVEALNNLEAGGRLVINAIRKENADKNALLQIDYARHLWMEKEIKSVANVAHTDISKFLLLAAEYNILPAVEEFAFDDANRALTELKNRKIRGAKVLVMK